MYLYIYYISKIMDGFNTRLDMTQILETVDELWRENAKWIEEERWKDPTFVWGLPEGAVIIPHHDYRYPIIILLGVFLVLFIIHYLIYHFKKKEHPIRKAIINSLIVMWILIVAWIILLVFFYRY